jgi:zinc transport system substrate-binding protein
MKSVVPSLLQYDCIKEERALKKLILTVVSVCLTATLCACQSAKVQENSEEASGEAGGLIVAVGIVPEAAFVEAVAGDRADVVTLVPPGCSPANYQPTATEMQALSDAAVYFTLQMPTEQANILPKVADFNESIRIVDLREAVAAVYPLLNGDDEEIPTGTESDSVDPHLWLSPKRAVVMVQTIADALSELDADNAAVYQANAADYIAELNALDGEIQEAVSALSNKTFLIYHAAYGYFAHDYGMTMIALQIEGKQATAEELQAVIDYAQENGIKTVFYQEEFDDSQAATVAEEIGGAVQAVAPLSADYMQGLKDFVGALAQSGD